MVSTKYDLESNGHLRIIDDSSNPHQKKPNHTLIYIIAIVVVLVIGLTLLLLLVINKYSSENITDTTNYETSTSETIEHGEMAESSSISSTNGKVPADAIAFNGHYYKLFEISLSWSEAEEYCIGLGGHLVSVNDSREQEFIESLSTSSSKINIWIGGMRNGDTWEWSDDSPFVYSNWDNYIGDDGEEYLKPDNYWGDEDYIRYANYDLSFLTWKANKGKWDDTGNVADGNEGDAPLSSFGFICEWYS